MTAILSMLSILAIAVLFYRAAERIGLPPLQWMIGGVLVYYSGFLIWMHGVLRNLMGSNFQTHGFGLGIGMDLTAILVGAGGALAFYRLVLLKKAPTA